MKVKHDIWEEGQRLKLDQVRWICNLLVLTKTTYLAVASEDKVFLKIKISKNFFPSFSALVGVKTVMNLTSQSFGMERMKEGKF